MVRANIDILRPGRAALGWALGTGTYLRAASLWPLSLVVGVGLTIGAIYLLRGLGGDAFASCRAGGASEAACSSFALLRSRVVLGALMPWVMAIGVLDLLLFCAVPGVLIVVLRRRRRERQVVDRLRRTEESYARGHLDPHRFARAEALLRQVLEKGIEGERERERALVGLSAVVLAALPILLMGHVARRSLQDRFAWSGSTGVFPELAPFLFIPSYVLGVYCIATIASEWRRGSRSRSKHEMAFESAWREVLDAAHDGSVRSQERRESP